MPPRRAGVVVATLLSSLAMAQRISAEVDLGPGTAREPLSSYQFDANVAFTGTGWGFFWQDDRSGHGEVWSALLDRDGNVLVPGVRRIVSKRQLSAVKSIAACSLPPHTLLAMASWETDTALLALSDDLRVQRTERLSTRLDERSALGCRSNPPLWVLPFSAYPTTGLEVVGLDRDGGTLPIDGGRFSSDLDVRDVSRARPAVAFDGARSLVVWAAGGRDGGVDGLDVFGAFVDGVSAGAPFLIAGGPGDQGQPAVDWYPTDLTYRVAYEEGLAPLRDVYSVNVAPDGTPSGLRAVAATPEDETMPTVHFSGSTLFTTWLSGLPKPDSLFLEPWLVGATPAELHQGNVDTPNVATDGAGRSMVGFRSLANGLRLVGRLVVDPLDAGPLLDPSTSLRAQRSPRIAAGEPGAVVAWNEAGQTLAVSLSGDSGVTAIGPGVPIGLTRGAGGLVVLTPQPTQVAVEVRDLDSLALLNAGLTWPMTNLVSASPPVWTGSSVAFGSIDTRSPTTRALSIDEGFADGGSVHLELGTLSTGPFEARLALAPSSDTWGLVWSTTGGVSLTCARRAVSMTPIEAVVGSGLYLPWPAVAAVGEQFLVAWVADRPTPPSEPVVLARRFDSGCRPLDATALELGPSVTVSGPSVVFDGLNFVVAWSSSADVLGDVMVRTVSPTGTLGPVIRVQEGNEADLAPVVGAVARGHWLIAYTRFHEAESESARRVHLRRVDDVANGTTCTADGECGSGFCVGNVCCSARCDGACNTCESGQCAVQRQGSVCRASSAACDAAETCDGTGTQCPNDGAGLTCARCSGAGPTHALSCGAAFSLPATSIPPSPGAPASWSLRRCDGSAAPAGVMVDPGTGAVTWTPEVVGDFPLLLVAQGPSDFSMKEFVLSVSCDGGVLPDGGALMDGGTLPDAGAQPGDDGGVTSRRSLAVSCGCTSVDLAAPLVFALMWLRRARRFGGRGVP